MKNVTASEMNQQMAYSEQVKHLVTAGDKTPKALVITYGCQQNENDSERIRGMLKQMGYDFTEEKEEADLILYNTCAVREGAEQRVLGNVGALVHEKRRRPNLLIGICGCMMQQEHMAKTIKQKYKHVSFVFGTHTLHKFPQILWTALNEEKTVISVEDSEGVIAEDVPVYREGSPKAWVSVMYGCNNFCTYCIVPYVRGRERSRQPENVLAEVRELVQKGVTEITLLGQNVNAYGKDLPEDIDFADLLSQINQVEGLKRIRFMTSHPKDMSQKLIDTMAACHKVMPQLHLPFQAGSDRILKEMNRRYTQTQYLDLVARVKKAMPGISMTTDIIVGFPNETKEDFEETIKVLEAVRFDSVFSFIYSKRQGTPAAIMEDSISNEEKHANFDRLLEVQNRISREINDSCFGKTFELLVEGESKTDENMLTGRTPEGKIVNFPKEDGISVGDYIHVTVTKTNTWSLLGEICRD
ncbi:MAG: tRNA (N6-isopentenyl adenosine(37)-C2)-methylthiotransferase MiaB [Ruminococcaceae bacterium]|nr:tRNA (N6-isopentenyl adenosine(37)-C2)-methylthiotransferase MiaB [Oscillospiraceae bacterium]